MKSLTITQLFCLRCGHKWFPKSQKLPVHCASCNSPNWNKPKIVAGARGKEQ